jgi:murein DD-endopeptidase MepM/ murein hydrolase activator NlpD
MTRFIVHILVVCIAISFGMSGAVSGAERTDGELSSVQGGLIILQRPGAVRVSLDGRPVPIARDGTFIIGFGRDFPPSARLEILTKDNATENLLISVKKRDYDVQYVNGLSERFVEPPQDTLERIRREAEIKAQARPMATDLTAYAQGFIWPLLGPVSGVYGSQRVYNGKPGTPHYGVDVAMPAGTPVRAPAGGIVTLAEDDFYFEGGVIFIDHGHGLISVLMHLSSVDVAAGQKIAKGEVVGKVGASGRATGAHLDWRIWWRDQRIDPQLLVPPMEEAIKEAKTRSATAP